jgi:cyclophilin family peptidyl-prolyl cis-trans isomerase
MSVTPRLRLMAVGATIAALGLAGGCREKPKPRPWTPPTSRIEVPASPEKGQVGQGQFTFDPDATYEALVRTTFGDFRLGFYTKETPKTVANFLRLASQHFYDGLTVFRVEADTLIQTGDPENTGTGGPGYSIPAEFTDRAFVAGTVGMARRLQNPDSAGSQWFVCLKRMPDLDKRFSAFAYVIDGLDVVRKISEVPVEGENAVTPSRAEQPIDPPIIKTIEVLTIAPGKPKEGPEAETKAVAKPQEEARNKP